MKRRQVLGGLAAATALPLFAHAQDGGYPTKPVRIIVGLGLLSLIVILEGNARWWGLIGLLPILWGTGTGASVMKRIAAPMIGGMVSSTVLTLVVVPAVYSLWRGRALDSDLD